MISTYQKLKKSLTSSSLVERLMFATCTDVVADILRDCLCGVGSWLVL